MSDTHINTYRCPDNECDWTLDVPTGPEIAPEPEKYEKAWATHLTTVHGAEVFTTQTD